MDGLFGKSETQASIPAHIDAASKDAIGMANDRNALGYVPYYGPEKAAFTGQQMAAMQGANQQASALGLQTAPMQIPTAQDFGGGVVGYDSAGMMEDNLARLQQANPELYTALMGLKDRYGTSQQSGQVDPRTGQPVRDYSGNADPSMSGGTAGFSGGGPIGGFIGDAFDGGGFGKSGDSFQGGLAAAVGNMLGGPEALAGLTGGRLGSGPSGGSTGSSYGGGTGAGWGR